MTATVGSFKSPVVDYIIAIVHPFSPVYRRKTGVTAGMVGQKVMMKSRFIATPDTTETMAAFGMHRCIQAMGHKTPLHGQVFCFVDRQAFVDAPTDGKMIENHIFLPIPATTQAITVQLMAITDTYTKIADNDLTGIYNERIIFQTDTLSRSRLSGNGDTVVLYTQVGFQFDGTIYSKGYDTGPFCFYSLTKTARTTVIQIGYDKDAPATSAPCMLAISLGTGKGDW